MKFSGHDILWSLLVPGGIALLVNLAGALFRGRGWASALAMGAGFVISFPAIYSETHWRIPAIPPPDSTGWLFYIAILTMICGAADAPARMPQWLRTLLVIFVAAIGLTLMLKFNFLASWSLPQGATIIAGFALLAGFFWATIGDCADQQSIVALLSMWLISSCSAVVVMLSSKSQGELFLPLAAAAFAMLPAVIWRGASFSPRGSTSTFAILITVMLAGSIYLTEVRPGIVIILATSPLALWLGRWAPARWKPWQRGLVRIVLTLIPLTTSLALAAFQFHRDWQPYSDANAYYSG